ncbi:hypothetical protein JB92DRAFT_3099780 [Gautieria morchelliformis]|nr:hypothetical protein JB92DRAFT_3099780 [Gautieria morchelliformis]
MEAKLKSQRVADLRELLQKASVPIPAKANKADLIAKILSSPEALAAFNNPGASTIPAPKAKAPEPSQGGQDDDLLAPPEEFDWGPTASNGAQASPAVPVDGPPKAVLKPTAAKPAVTPGTAAEQSTKKGEAPTATGTSETAKDEELEKRKRRAARFGIPLVETKPKATPASNGTKAPRDVPKPQTVPAEEEAKIKARAARFAASDAVNTTAPAASTAISPAGGKKRARSPVPVDKEEMERRKRRAERFSSGGEAKAQS